MIMEIWFLTFCYISIPEGKTVTNAYWKLYDFIKYEMQPWL